MIMEMDERICLMNKLICIGLLGLVIGSGVGLQAAPVAQADFFSSILDIRQLSALKGIQVHYLTTKGSQTTDDVLDYNLAGVPVITCTSRGDLAQAVYRVSLKPNYSPATFEHQYKSNAEHLDFWEFFQYETPLQTVFTDRLHHNVTRFDNDARFADSVTMMEYLVFSRIDQLTELRMNTVVSPGALRIPFILRRTGEETVSSLDGKSYDCWVYSAEIDNMLSVFVKIFYGDARIWVMKDFPHLRVKMDFFHKSVSMKDYTVLYASSGAQVSQTSASKNPIIQ